MNLLLLLDRIEQMVQEGPRMPLGNRCLINASEALELIDKMREALPEQVRRADEMASETERLLKQSRIEADRILREAEEYVARLVSESEVLRKAEEEAERIIGQARRKAEEIEAGADTYAAGVLGNLQTALERTLRTVKQGRSELDA